MTNQRRFREGIFARQAALRYMLIWCRNCRVRPRDAAAILRLLAEAPGHEQILQDTATEAENPGAAHPTGAPKAGRAA